MKVERRLGVKPRTTPHSCHWFAARTSYSCPEPSSKENTFDECHESGSGQYQLLLTVRARSTKKQVALPLKTDRATAPFVAFVSFVH